MQVDVNNRTKKLCVIGDPVLHSKSPLIQNSMICALGLDYLYLCQPVPRGRAGEWLRCAAFAGYAGFNATMPHKQELAPLMDELDEDAKMFGAVNTVCLRDGRAYGYNTDGQGFLNALEDAGIETRGRSVLLLGAGGAAKAVAVKLCQDGRAGRVFVANRTIGKAAALCALDPRGTMIPADFSSKTLGRLAAEADLVVNCTNLGMEGTQGQFEDFSFLEALGREAPVCDLIYSPLETELLRRARLAGHPVMNGLGMLLHQAVLALEHFTGLSLDRRVACQAAQAALERDMA